MAVASLLGKDIREHWLAALALAVGTLAMTLMMLAWNRQAPYSMSSFEIVRFALLSFLPMMALITGNRLIVRDYLSGTRQFVEALPIGRNLPLILKFLLGLIYLSLLACVMVLMAAQQAGIADDVTPAYLSLILAKTLIMTLLYWSIVFCFSLCGHLRVALYLLLGALVALVAWYPGIDAERLAPFALMDDQLFVFERDLIPWQAMWGTVLIALLFTLAGLVLTRIGEGALVERLARPMTRRDHVALGVLAASGLTVWSTLIEQQERPPVAFSSEHVVRLQDPALSVLYLDEQYKTPAQDLAARLSDSMTRLQASLGLLNLPDVRLVLDAGREAHDIDYATVDGVFITANWLEHDSYDDAILDTVILHGVMSAQTSGRAMFEPYHWVLDGFTRWWVEQGSTELSAAHESELLARALWVLDVDPQAHRLIDRWQLTADRFAYPGAESLAWSAMHFIEQTRGREAVLSLARSFLVSPVGDNVLGSLRDRRISARQRVEAALDQSLGSFYTDWLAWLQTQSLRDTVQDRLAGIPALKGRLESQQTEGGALQIVAWYERRESALALQQDMAAISGECIMKHDYIGPFDSEIEVRDDDADEVRCQTITPAHVLNSFYAPGDRVYIALDYDGEPFHQPLRLHAERMSIP